jgi:hypothetical protein
MCEDAKLPGNFGIGPWISLLFFEVIKINSLRQDGFIRLFISAGLRRRMLGGARGLGNVRFGFYFGSG